MRIFRILLLIAALLALPACGATSTLPTVLPTLAPTRPPTAESTQAPTPETGQYVPLPTQGPSIPGSEAEVPRTSVIDAKAAFDAGEAIIVDVRSAEAFTLSHVAGAINIPLAELEGHLKKMSKETYIVFT